MKPILRPPVDTLTLDFETTPVTTSAWVEVSSATNEPCSGIEIYNPALSALQISTGAGGDEDNHILPYTILPGGSSIFLAFGIKKASRVSIKALDDNATVGTFIMNLFA